MSLSAGGGSDPKCSPSSSSLDDMAGARGASYHTFGPQCNGSSSPATTDHEAMACNEMTPLKDFAVEASDHVEPDATGNANRPLKCNVLAQLIFSHANAVMAIGNQRQLGFEDLWDLERANCTRVAFHQFRQSYQQSRQSVYRAIWRTYGGRFLLCGFGSLVCAGCGVFAPVVLHHVIDAFTTPQLDMQNLLLWLAAFFASRLVNAVLISQVAFQMEIIAMQMTCSLKSLLFAKTMTRTLQSRDHKEGYVDISNLYTSDVTNILWAALQFNQLWITPIQITCVVYLLYLELNVAALAGLLVIGVTMVLSFVIAKFMGKSFQQIMKQKDLRMKVVKEVFGAIQIIKFNAWETKSWQKIQRLRAKEMTFIARYLYAAAGSIFVLWSTPIFVSCTSFAVYALLLGKTLTAVKVFTAISLFNAIRYPLRELPRIVQQCIQAKVSLDRMTKFLQLAEHDPNVVTRDGSEYAEDVAIEIENGTFGWTEDTPILNQVNLRVKKGDFVVVHGAVGSGKSSLCSALLGEMIKTSGKVFVRGRVAYYSQQPWIQNMSVRENILFGLPYDQAKYDAVVAACGLLPDFDQLPAGDSTEIGQKGVNLSGGQKARVSLARACYVDADTLILDAPLAAVDTVVQSEIFHRCLCGLLKTKTVVLVTHSQDIIHSEASNYKVLVDNGEVSGTRVDPIQPRETYSCMSSLPTSRKCRKPEGAEENEKKKNSSALVVEEERRVGRVSKAVFMQYFEAVGGLRVVLCLTLIQLTWQGFQIGSDLWLSHWTGSKNQPAVASLSAADVKHNMLVYALLGLGAAVMVLARSVTVSMVGLRASRDLFQRMTLALLHSPLRFFDANPIGRIVNRFADDISAIDFRIPFAYGSFFGHSFLTVCQLATAVYMVRALGILMLPLFWLYVKLANFSLMPSREISRLLKVSSSPVLSHVSQCEEGLAVIRAFGSDFVDRAITDSFKHIDTNNRAWYMETIVSQWFAVRMQFLGSAVVMVVVSALVYLHAYLSPGMVGIAFTYALNVDAGLSAIVEVWTWLEVVMVSPERVMEYANLPAEGSEKPLALEPSVEWPRRGSLRFENVVFNYKPGAPSVLKGVSFAIENREKIGVVGRTGAGKSSLTMALFRINELASGRILIDGVDISTMSLRTLRSRLSIIPQSPVLFKGTLRAYMDPFDEYVDSEIWDALGKVHLTEMVSGLQNKLLFELSENGENFSVGERQMLCMARALLRKSRVVVLDEATASIDHGTEQKLQATITREFTEATVVTIAHRLSTVLQSSRILVMEDGHVVELDRPDVLLQNPRGALYAFAKEGGYLETFGKS